MPCFCTAILYYESMAHLSSGFKGERFITIPQFIIDEIKANELGKELYIKDIGYYPKADFHYYEHNSNETDDYVLLYCVGGKGWVNVDNNKYSIKENQLLILSGKKDYIYGSDRNSPWTIYWIHFNGEKADYFSKGFEQPTLIARNSTSRISQRLNIFEEIYTALNSGYMKNNLLYAITGFFHFLGTIKFNEEFKGCSQREIKTTDIVNTAINYMSENIGRKISLTEVSNYVGLSESYFSALFNKEMGTSPLRYYDNLRLKLACHYLENTDMKMNQICPLVGYDDSLYFSRAFAKVIGMSPSEYKSNNLKKRVITRERYSPINTAV